MVQVVRTYPTPAALLAIGLPTGYGSEPEVYIQRRNMADSLFKAVTGCRFTRVRFLLANDVSANSINDEGLNLLVTALYIEEDDKRYRMFRYLLKRGVDCCHVDTKTGRDVLSWACLLGRHVQVAHTMETAIGELNFTRADKQGMTALHHATIQGHIEVVRLLVAAMNKYHLAVDVTDKQGLTPFIYAKRLGHFAIADVLLREGHCSPRQFDDFQHISAEDWTQIGLRERKQFSKQQHRDMLAQHKIRGKIQKSLNKCSLLLPTITLSEVGSDSSNSSNQQDQGSNGEAVVSKSMRDHVKGEVTHIRNGAAGPKRWKIFNSKGQLGASLGMGTNGSKNTMTLPRISERRFTSPGPILQATHNKSMDTAFALLDVQANQSSQIVHAAQFVHSQLDTSKVTESSGMMGNLTSMMDVLSEQQTGAFRVVAKPPTPPVVPQVNPSVPKKKKNVSTLALLFGKNNTSRRCRPAAKGNKQKCKTLAQLARAKKQKSSARHRTK